tara:strand:- start:31654 stop:32397 length:744 start_codon:yes stop_codon:yes gene_type:complete
MGIKCKEVIFNPVAPLYFIISGGTLSISPQHKNGKIVSLAMPNDSFIAVGDKLKIKGEPYKINIIEKIKDGGALVYHLKTAERTKSSIFVLPMLSGDKHLFLYDSNLINAFIKHDNSEDCIVLLYRWSSDPLFAKFDLALRKFPTFIKAFDADTQHTVYIFEIPEHHDLNFKYFKEGKYSKLDDDFKLKILEFHGMGVDSSLSKILFKSEERKKELEKKLDAEIPENSELLSIIDVKNETLNLDYYL